MPPLVEFQCYFYFMPTSEIDTRFTTMMIVMALEFANDGAKPAVLFKPLTHVSLCSVICRRQVQNGVVVTVFNFCLVCSLSSVSFLYVYECGSTLMNLFLILFQLPQ